MKEWDYNFNYDYNVNHEILRCVYCGKERILAGDVIYPKPFIQRKIISAICKKCKDRLKEIGKIPYHEWFQDRIMKKKNLFEIKEYKVNEE